MRERCDKTTRCCVDMDWDIDARLLLVSVQDIVNLLYRFVVAGVGATQDYEDTNGILVDVLLD